jgi:hypothetical protein
MSFLPVYLDSSAIVKLIVEEPETEALLSALIGRFAVPASQRPRMRGPKPFSIPWC